MVRTLEDICIKQPDNIGITCHEHDKCDHCGWNPEYLKVLRERKQNKKAGKD